MSLTERVRETADRYGVAAGDDYLTDLERRYQELVRRGLIVPQKYDFPPLDTIGRRMRRMLEKAQKDGDIRLQKPRRGAI